MVEALTYLITSQGWFAPLWYVGGFLLAALVPIIPTPLIAALGGTAFGTLAAILYGLVGMGAGAAAALVLARRLGLPLVRRLVPARTWAEWEALLGIRSLWAWGVIFFVLNLDLAVIAAGLSGVSLRALWWTAMTARLPWLIASAWFGDVVLVSDFALLIAAVVVLPFLILMARFRPRLQALLARWAHQPER